MASRPRRDSSDMMRTWTGGAGAERVHEPEEARALDELGAADAVVDVDGLFDDQPAVPGGVLPRVLDLAGHGALVLADSALVGGLARVDGGVQVRTMPAPGTHATTPSDPPASSMSPRSRTRASASAETTAENTAGGHSKDGRGEGPRCRGGPNGHVMTRPWKRIASVSGLQNSRHG